MTEPTIYCDICEAQTEPRAIRSDMGVAWCSSCGASVFDDPPDWDTLENSDQWDDYNDGDFRSFLVESDQTPKVFGNIPERVGSITSANLSTEGRQERLPQWAGMKGINLPANFIPLLAQCDSASEVRFIWEIVSASDWNVLSEDTFSNGVYQLTVQAKIAQFRADILLNGPEFYRKVAIEIDGQSHAQRRSFDKRRQLIFKELGIDTYRVGSEAAAQMGQRFRNAFILDSLSPRPNSLQPVKSVSILPRKQWLSADWAFNLTGILEPQRRLLLLDWLDHRSIVLRDDTREDLLHFLSYLNKGPEILLVLPILSLAGWKYSDKVASCEELKLTIGSEIHGVRVDIIKEYRLETNYTICEAIFIQPASHQINNDIPNSKKLQTLWEAEYRVITVESSDCHSLGTSWKENLSMQRRNRLT